ncbi:MAG: SDR family NAD(P)-dependent oxidoreductase [Candidatus Dormibacteraceae bacterium]
MSPSDFRGRVAIVTGGATGIGHATARRLAQGGATVFVGDRSSHLEESVAELRQEGLDVHGRRADVRSAGDLQALAGWAVEVAGGVDALCCCAGIQTYGTAVDTSEETWDQTLDVNVKGMFLAAKHTIPALRRRGGGAIVLVASVQGIACQTGVVAYAASKGAILAMTRAIALDHAREGIRCNAVCPGSVDTPMLRGAADLFRGERTQDELVAEWGLSHPMGRVARPDEVAEVIAFLAGERSSFVTGSQYVVDGGLLAGVAVALPHGEEGSR